MSRKRSLYFCGKPNWKNSPAATPRSQESLEPFPRASPAPFAEMPGPKAVKDLSRKLDAFMDTVNKRLDRMESMLCEVREELRVARVKEPASKKLKRAGNCSASEAVRRLHNGENNTHRYDPKTSVSSPHNQGVTTHLMREVSLVLPDVEPEVTMASCKTYFETIRKSYRMDQDLQKKEESRIAARMRQRKRRLYNARAGVLQTGEEALWGTATVDLMSEEEDSIVDGRPVWVVRPPPRSAELSTLCGVLQQRLDTDQKYVLTHRQRLASLEAIDH
ncbi:uncharacterized protein C14orf93-like [Nelusetta ayraudi]|uniref:uncharacterized protein C14orf93-like n=1 Tax=Nelusetta ayraudi TaxID=303726 RepID=UPI003F70F823